MFISCRNTWTLKIIISVYVINDNYLNICTLDSYFYLLCKQQLFEQPYIAASYISLVRSCFENMNLEFPHQVVFLHETWLYATGSESNMSSDGTKSGGYHDSLNGENFENWMLTQLLPNLEELSIVVMGNAPYYIVLEKSPTQSWRKDEIIAWLQEKRISFTKGYFKAELLNLITANTSSRKGRENLISSTFTSEQIIAGV
jgi:hypothetical protein